MPEGEPFASAPQTRLDFVHYEQRAVLPAKLLRFREKFGRGNVDPVPLDGLGDERRHVPLFELGFEVFEVVEIDRLRPGQERAVALVEMRGSRHR